jgi:hypothetical protein
LLRNNHGGNRPVWNSWSLFNGRVFAIAVNRKKGILSTGTKYRGSLSPKVQAFFSLVCRCVGVVVPSRRPLYYNCMDRQGGGTSKLIAQQDDGCRFQSCMASEH